MLAIKMKETNEQMYSEAEQPVREVGPSTVCNSGLGWGGNPPILHKNNVIYQHDLDLQGFIRPESYR